MSANTPTRGLTTVFYSTTKLPHLVGRINLFRFQITEVKHHNTWKVAQTITQQLLTDVQGA